MQTPIQTLKRFADINRWRQWAIVFLAGVLMLVSTAQAMVPNPTTRSTPTPKAETTPKTGGMYPYKDTYRDTSAADAKADRMIREAKQRAQQGSD
jgi:hypothetical protein